VILIDNQRYIRKDSSIRNNIASINALIVEPFYNLLCAGEEKKRKHIGAKTLDAGDILQTLSGWTVIGYGKSPLPLIGPFRQTRNFRDKSTETHKGIHAMDEALSELSLTCNPQDANRALYLLSAPAREMNMDLVIIRSGDYPRQKGVLDVTVILSELDTSAKIKSYYALSTTVIEEIRVKREEIACKLKDIDDAAKDIPSLL
jgi:hypothetical protein